MTKQKRSKESLQLLTKFVKEAIEETIAEEKEELIQADLKKANTLSEAKVVLNQLTYLLVNNINSCYVLGKDFCWYRGYNFSINWLE